jgi:hypothetical protein
MTKAMTVEVVGGEVLPDANGRYQNAEWLHITIKVPLSRSKDFPMGSLVRVTPQPSVFPKPTKADPC